MHDVRDQTIQYMEIPGGVEDGVPSHTISSSDVVMKWTIQIFTVGSMGLSSPWLKFDLIELMIKEMTVVRYTCSSNYIFLSTSACLDWLEHRYYNLYVHRT